MHEIITGMSVMGYATAGLFFLKFWKQTKDRLFALFATAFWILGAQRLALGVSTRATEDLTYLFVIRLIGFLIILYAIIDKNLTARRNARREG